MEVAFVWVLGASGLEHHAFMIAKIVAKSRQTYLSHPPLPGNL